MKDHIRYDVISGPSPEYLAGHLYGRLGIYAVVKLVNDDPPILVQYFGGWNSSEERRKAYKMARELNDAKKG